MREEIFCLIKKAADKPQGKWSPRH